MMRTFLSKDNEEMKTPLAKYKEHQDGEVGDVSSEQDYTMQGTRGASFVDRKGRFFYTSEGTKAPVAVVVVSVVRTLDATTAVDPTSCPCFFGCCF